MCHSPKDATVLLFSKRRFTVFSLPCDLSAGSDHGLSSKRKIFFVGVNYIFGKDNSFFSCLICCGKKVVFVVV